MGGWPLDAAPFGLADRTPVLPPAAPSLPVVVLGRGGAVFERCAFGAGCDARRASALSVA